MKRIAQSTFVLLFVLAGCVTEQTGPVEVPQMTIRAEIPGDPLAKASFSVPDGGTGLHLAWQEGDNIRVIDKDNALNNGQLNIQAGYTDHVADFSGPTVSGDYFNIVCPGAYTSVAEAEEGSAVLTQSGNGSTGHLVFTALLGNVAKADLESISFNSEWASDHGCTFKRGGIVKLILTLPDAITAPKKVEMAIEDSGVLKLERTLNVTGVDLTSEHVLTVYLQSPWDDIAFTDVSVRVMDADGTCYSATRGTGGSQVTLKAGYQNSMALPGAGSFTEDLFAGGDGTASNPWLLANAKHLDNMHGSGILKHQEKVYFRLIDDIDMQDYLSSNSWIPLNVDNPYDYLVDFDGDGHTISHLSCSSSKDPSFFGVLYGSCHDVTFADASITSANGPCGIVAGYIGYTNKRAVVHNVHVSGTVKRTGSGTSGTGGMAGLVNFSSIESCSSTASINVTGTDFVGGLIGRDDGDPSHIRNCWTSGTIYGNQKIGGIIGGLIKAESEVVNCFSTAAIDAMRFAGGIIGDACLDAGSSSHYAEAATLTPDNVVKGCIAWQSTFATRDVRTGPVDSWGSGAIIGLTALKNYLTDCRRNASLDTHWTEVNGVTPYDQENASPSSQLVISNPAPDVMKHYYPYHGKAYSGTLSACARSLGWDEGVWDLSGDIPVLTGAVQTDDLASGDSSILSVVTTARAFPTDGITSNGLTWDVSAVRDGIRYYHGYGTPTDSWWGYTTYGTSAAGQYQEIFVVDMDLSKTAYDVKIVVASPNAVTSEVFRQTGAIAAINGGYEKGSVAIKGNAFLNTDTEDFTVYPSGYPYSYMPNNTISVDGYEVDNWKSEGTFYSDGHQGVRISFDAYNGGATGKTSTDGTTLKSIKEMRRFYRECTDDEPGFISSAPVLDANYVRFGMSFYSRAASGSYAESPRVHQGSCYSRTAVGIAYPNGDSNEPHLLLIVNDGKYTNGTNGYGMTAYQLERIIANFFGPKYLLNLDGGGSATMCVEGQGDASSHVVNYPSDNYTGKIAPGGIVDHAGERARDTFIVIVPAE